MTRVGPVVKCPEGQSLRAIPKIKKLGSLRTARIRANKTVCACDTQLSRVDPSVTRSKTCTAGIQFHFCEGQGYQEMFICQTPSTCPFQTYLWLWFLDVSPKSGLSIGFVT